MGKKKPFFLHFNIKGQDEKAGPLFIEPSSAELIKNLHMEKIGSWTAYKQGYTNFTDELESGAAIDGLGWYTDATGTDYLLAAVNGKVLHINEETGATTATATSSLTAGNLVDFATFKGSVYIAEKSITPLKWAGSGSATTISNIPLTNGSETYDKPHMVEVYQNRMVYANFNGTTKYPSHVVISDDLAPETFTLGTDDTDGGVVQIAPGDGQHIKALKRIYLPAQGDEILLVFKDRSVYAIEGYSPSTFRAYNVSPITGALNNRCVVQVGADVLYMDRTGIHSLTTALQSGTIQPRALGTQRIQETYSDLNLSASEAAWASHLPERQEVWFAIPTGSRTEADTILIYRYPNTEEQLAGLQPVWSVRDGKRHTAGLLFNRTFFTGGNDGYLRRWFLASQYNGTGFEWRYRFPYYNFGAQVQSKRVIECFLWFQMLGNETFTIQTRWRGGGGDFEKTLSKTIGPTSSAAVYGTSPPAGVYGTDYYGGGATWVKVKIPVYGNGEALQFEVSGTTGGTAPIFVGISGLVEFAAPSRSYR